VKKVGGGVIIHQKHARKLLHKVRTDSRVVELETKLKRGVG